ncbi:MAG: ribosome maturation factor RimM [Alphaproteobacteria bacterium]
MTDGTKRVCLGAIAGAFGVRGAVRIKTFTAEPRDVAAYGPVSDESGGRTLALTVERTGPDHVIARIGGVADRDSAEKLKGTRLYVERRAMPDPDEANEYYAADLIGAVAEDRDGHPFGTVSAVHDFGAGNVLEIERPDGESILLPFTRTVVPGVDIGGGRIVVDPPAGLLESPERRPARRHAARRRAKAAQAREHA